MDCALFDLFYAYNTRKMKRDLFFALLIVLFIFLWYQSSQVEAFQSRNSVPMNIPQTSPGPAPTSAGDPKPFAPPSNALLAPPPGQTASVNSYPFQDPSYKKAPLKELKNTLETLDGFLGIEAPKMGDSSDPEIQLPLETARADLRRLQDDISVINQNPGLEGSITIGDLNNINANLAFLQKRWRMSASSLEGFQNASSWRNTRVYEGFANGVAGSVLANVDITITVAALGSTVPFAVASTYTKGAT